MSRAEARGLQLAIYNSSLNEGPHRNHDVSKRQHGHDGLRDDCGGAGGSAVEDVADLQQAANRSQKPQQRDDDGGVHRVLALALVARKQARERNHKTKGGGNERGQARGARQEIAGKSNDDEGDAKRDSG